MLMKIFGILIRILHIPLNTIPTSPSLTNPIHSASPAIFNRLVFTLVVQELITAFPTIPITNSAHGWARLVIR
jgi:hypothetical protein